MKIYVHTAFEGHYPVGVSALVVAESTTEAAMLLEGALDEQGLCQEIDPDDFVEIETDGPDVRILNDGDY